MIITKESLLAEYEQANVTTRPEIGITRAEFDALKAEVAAVRAQIGDTSPRSTQIEGPHDAR